MCLIDSICKNQTFISIYLSSVYAGINIFEYKISEGFPSTSTIFILEFEWRSGLSLTNLHSLVECVASMLWKNNYYFYEYHTCYKFVIFLKQNIHVCPEPTFEIGIPTTPKKYFLKFCVFRNKLKVTIEVFTIQCIQFFLKSFRDKL